LQFFLQAASPETSGYTLVSCFHAMFAISAQNECIMGDSRSISACTSPPKLVK